MSICSLFSVQGWRGLGFVAGLLLCNPLLAAPSQALIAPREVVWADFLGVNAQFLWFDEAHYRQQVQQLRTLGLKWVRVDLHWDRMEPAPGHWQLASLDRLNEVLVEQNINSLMYLVGSAAYASSAPNGAPNSDQYPPLAPELFAESLGFLAQRYPAVKAWQVWNEPNISSFWQPMEDPAAYQHLLDISMTRLAITNPAAQRVGAGMAYYSQMPQRGGLLLDSLANAGALHPDQVVAYHPYSLSPEGDDPAAMDFVLRAKTLNQQLRARGSGPIWATEFGWSSYTGAVEWQPIIGEQGQADYLLKRIALMSALDFDRVFLFNLSDLDGRATARDQKYGLLRLDGTAKPAFSALRRMLTITGPRLKPEVAPAFNDAPAGMLNIAWKRDDGRWVWIFWAQQPGQVTLKRKGIGTLYDPLTGKQRNITVGSAGLLIDVGTQLQMVVM
jgi:beta-xylosidase